MEHIALSPQHHHILTCLICLPEKIIALQGKENTTTFVLQDLCGSQCFNLPKAAYLVDNPDFNCLKGIAGYDETEAYQERKCWENPEAFDCHLKTHVFNKAVREIFQPSLYHTNSKQTALDNLASQLSIKNPAYYTWPMKHNNHGIFLYEPNKETEHYQESLKKGLNLFSFCPIF